MTRVLVVVVVCHGIPPCTMCDFHNFGLIFKGHCTVCLKGAFGAAPFEKISNNVDFSLWGNLATTQNTFFDIFKWD